MGVGSPTGSLQDSVGDELHPLNACSPRGRGEPHAVEHSDKTEAPCSATEEVSFPAAVGVGSSQPCPLMEMSSAKEKCLAQAFTPWRRQPSSKTSQRGGSHQSESTPQGHLQLRVSTGHTESFVATALWFVFSICPVLFPRLSPRA